MHCLVIAYLCFSFNQGQVPEFSVELNTFSFIPRAFVVYDFQLFFSVASKFYYYYHHLILLFLFYFYLFFLFLADTDDSLLSGSVSYEDSSPGQERNMNNDNSPTNDSDRTPGSNIDTVYQQALQLIECTETLKSVPQQLTAMGEELQKLATEMVDSTERLKRQSDAVMKANVS